MVTRLRPFVTRFRYLLLGAGFVIVYVLGVIGWLQTAPELGVLNSAYASLALFVVASDPTVNASILLNICRFLAPILAAYAIVIVAVRILASQRALSRALQTRGGTLVIGRGAIAFEAVARFLDAAYGSVVFLTDGTGDDALRLRKRGVIQIETVDDASLRKLVQRTSRVIVTFENDAETAATMKRLRDANGASNTPTYAIFDNADLASSWWRQANERVVSMPGRLATAVLERVPPILASRDMAIAPPPIVIGEGDVAVSLVRRLAVAWQQPGERMQLHAAGADREWVDQALSGLESQVELQWHDMQQHPVQAVRVVERALAEWVPPDRPDRYRIVGPRVYISFSDDSRAVPLASAIARAVPGSRVVCLVDEPGLWWRPVDETRLTFLSRRELISAPDAIFRTREEDFTSELLRDAESWPEYEDAPIDVIASAMRDSSGGAEEIARERCAAEISRHLDGVFRAAGISLEWSGTDEATILVLTPQQLLDIGQGIARELGMEQAMPHARLRQALLGVAERLPTMLARTGVRPGLPDGASGAFGAREVLLLARAAHDAYRGSVTENASGTDSANAQRTWDELSEVERRSNVAQAVDIPLKLALVGLSLVRVAAPRVYCFSDDEIEVLSAHEHRRWAHFQVRNGRSDHALNRPWSEIGEETRNLDRDAVRALPEALAAIGFEIVDPQGEGGRPEDRWRAATQATDHPDGAEFTRTGFAWAWRLTEATQWTTLHGDVLTGEPGDWWVVTEDGTVRTVKPEFFELSYSQVRDQLYRRTGTIRARRVAEPETVETSEGSAGAAPGDWIATGESGERWPIESARFTELYSPG